MATARNSRSTEPPDLPGRVAAFFAPRLASGRRVAVGLSGGRDSVALLQALAEARRSLPLDLSAVHVHHGLSPRADEWVDFCADLCRSLDIPCQCVAVHVAVDSGEGLEAAARRARYAVFRSVAADWLALAHHRDDQAETLLLNLLRGAGSDGLAAMPDERPLAAGLRLVRPFLGLARQQIEVWLAARQLAWIDDESNANTRLRRNFLRREVLPLLATVFPDPLGRLADAALQAGTAALLADDLAAIDAAGCVDGETLVIAALNALPPARRGNLLRRFLRSNGLRMPDARYLSEILRQLAVAAPDTTPAFSLDGADLQVARGRLQLVRASPENREPLVWRGEASLPWAGGRLCFTVADGAGLSRRLLEPSGLIVRPRQGGERLQPDARRPRRLLKKLLQESGLPSWQRQRLPLAWCGDELVWVAGIGYAAACVAAPGEPGLVLRWEPGWALSPEDS